MKTVIPPARNVISTGFKQSAFPSILVILKGHGREDNFISSFIGSNIRSVLTQCGLKKIQLQKLNWDYKIEINMKFKISMKNMKGHI